MAKKRLNSDQDEFKFQAELAPSLIRSQIVIDGVTISGSDWETLTGESRILPVRLIRIPDEQTRDQEQSERVGLALRQMQSMLPEDRDYTIEVTRNCVKVTNENGVSVARVDDVDFDWNDEAGMWETLREKLATFLRSK